MKGGYIAIPFSNGTDGGELYLQERRVTGTHAVHGTVMGMSEYEYETIEKDYEYRDTEAKVQTEAVMDVADYLISTYGDSRKPYFDNLSEIQRCFGKECLYYGVYVFGDQKRSTKRPYYSLASAGHVDLDFCILSPYYRLGNKSMLVSQLYPMIYDSLGFPFVMWKVAERLDSTVSVKRSAEAHYSIDVTYHGETRHYGGAGVGGGQGIYADQVKYWYSFDGSADDAYMKRSLKDVSSMIREYGELKVMEEPADEPELTMESIRETVGKEGSYVKITIISSGFGANTTGYTFVYDDENKGGGIGHFSNAWYDGRYFNKWEYYFPGAEFEDTVKRVSPNIVMKDVNIKLPEDGKAYYYGASPIDEIDRYNAETGRWSGFMEYRYDSQSRTWKADILNRICYRGDNGTQRIDDQNFIDACTITMDEALAMKLDANTNKAPSSYYIYDGLTSPGTYFSEGN